MKEAHYMDYDSFAQRQENNASLWLQQLKMGLLDCGVNPDHAVAFCNDLAA